MLLGGDDGEATEFVKVRNVAGDKERRYSMDPLEQAAAEQRADADGKSITGIFHSHTFTQAHPSAIDVRNAVDSMWTGPNLRARFARRKNTARGQGVSYR